MATLTVQVPDSAMHTLAKLIKEMGGKIVSVPSEEEAGKEKALLNQIEAGLKDVAAIQSGKIKRVSLADGLRG